RVYTPHGGSLVYRPGTFMGGFYRSLEWLLKWRTDLFLFESGYAASLFRAEMGRPPAMVRASSLAFIEPSPHDGLMLVLPVMCVAARVPFDRKLTPLLVLLMIWLIGGCLSLIQVGDQQQAIQ